MTFPLIYSYWFVGGADRGNTTSSSSYSGPSCMSLSSTVPSTPQPGGGGGGGGSGGKRFGPSGHEDVGDIRQLGSSEVGEDTPPTVPELVPRISECPPLPVADISPLEPGYIILISGGESGEVLEFWRMAGSTTGPRSVTRTLVDLE